LSGDASLELFPYKMISNQQNITDPKSNSQLFNSNVKTELAKQEDLSNAFPCPPHPPAGL
jgi:hypothetical protein